MDQGGSVTAVATNGAVLWQTSIQPGYDAKSTTSGGGLAVSGGTVFATTGYGELIALDTASGGIIWRQRMDAAVSGAPTVDGTAVYAIGRDGGASALNAATGRILWQVAGTPSTRGVLGAGTPAANGSAVYLPFASGQIEAVDTASGDTQWIGAIGGKRLGRAYAGFGDISGDPVVADGVLYVGSSAGRTIALDAQTGNRIWSAPEGAMNAPLVVGGSVFTVNDQSRLVRMSAATGDLIWSSEMPYFTQIKPKKYKKITAHYGPVLAGGHLVVASGDGALRLFNPASGELTAEVDIPGGAAAPPALAAGLLFVMGANGQLHAFR
jgi:outer membrane protein assembly factor BamB